MNDNRTTELLPCPFCGGEAEKLTSIDGFTSIGCLNCNPYFGVMIQATTEAEAIAAWNSRAERTCKVETDHAELEAIASSHEDTWAYKCSACDWSFRYDRGIKPNYCPNCGCKVVGESKMINKTGDIVTHDSLARVIE